ncbi:MAG: hypothetical protein JST30_11000 [Armatimonadetes bacterium]|nr:hypothetical protein [Armatimonadota bacterium]
MTAPLIMALVLGRPSAWSINENNALIWGGRPYLPVGLEIPANVSAVRQAKAAGVRDVLLDFTLDDPKSWSEACKELDEAGMTYMARIMTAAPVGSGVTVEPGGFRISDVTKKTFVDVPMPETDEALLVMAVQRDGSVRWSRREKTVDGRLRTSIDPLVELPHTLLVYPVGKTVEATDFYEGLDAQRDRLLGFLKTAPPGPGFRGLVDPLGSELAFPGADASVVPKSRLFLTEMVAFLETKYTSVSTATKAWGLSANDLDRFDKLARLVPLWSETRGVADLWDADTDRLYPVDRQSSLAWRDVRTVVANVARRRLQTLLDNIRLQIDAPVLSTWSGWDGPYSTRDSTIDGVAFRPSGESAMSLWDTSARPVSSVLRREKPGLVAATGLNAGQSVEDTVMDLESLGVRAWFFEAQDDGQRQAVGRLAATRATDVSSAEWRPKALFYPEAAQDPAFPSRLTGGLLWLPSPGQGRRVLYGSDFEGYESAAGQNVYVLWSTTVPRKVSVRVSDVKTVTVEDVQGTAVPFRKKKNEIELEVPTTPLVFRGSSELPVPTVAFAETSGEITKLLDANENLVNPTGRERFQFLDAVKAFDRTPGASFLTLRAQLERIAPRAAPYLWIAATRSPRHNFGETGPVPGAASDTVLATSARLPSFGVPLFAEYPLAPRLPGQYEVWIAARIPAALRSQVRMAVGDKVLGPPEKPLSYYGDGFGWYKFGDIELPKGVTNFRFECPMVQRAGIALDVVHVALPGFRPQGPRMPLDWLKSIVVPKGPEKGKG